MASRLHYRSTGEFCVVTFSVMLAEQKKRTNPAKLATVIIFGVFFLYVLSLGPLCAMERHGILPQLAPAFELYTTPANWLARIRPLHRLMEWYVARWLNLTDAPDTTI